METTQHDREKALELYKPYISQSDVMQQYYDWDCINVIAEALAQWKEDGRQETLKVLSLIQRGELTEQEEAWAKELIPEVEKVLREAKSQRWRNTVGKYAEYSALVRTLDAAEASRKEGERE